jgi:acyl carrier protein
MNAASDDLVALLIEVAADVFSVPATTLSADSTPESVEAWDSISHLNLMLAVEQAAGVRIEPERMAELTSLTKIAEAVRKLQTR